MSYTKEDLEKSWYFVQVAAEYYNYKTILHVNSEGLHKVISLAELLQKEVHKAENKLLDKINKT